MSPFCNRQNRVDRIAAESFVFRQSLYVCWLIASFRPSQSFAHAPFCGLLCFLIARALRYAVISSASSSGFSCAMRCPASLMRVWLACGTTVRKGPYESSGMVERPTSARMMWTSMLGGRYDNL